MNRYARAFQITVWAGVLVNMTLAVSGVLAPDWLLRSLGFDVAYPNVWPRFAAWLLILLSLFYIPGANDLNRYRANAVLAVVARIAGVFFFTGAVVLVGFSSRYLLFGLIDLVFALPSGLFLLLAIRQQRREGERTRVALEPRTIGVAHGVAAQEVAQTR